jgi:hypothetical protein
MLTIDSPGRLLAVRIARIEIFRYISKVAGEKALLAAET